MLQHFGKEAIHSTCRFPDTIGTLQDRFPKRWSRVSDAHPKVKLNTQMLRNKTFWHSHFDRGPLGAAASWSYLITGGSNTCSLTVKDSQLLWLQNMCTWSRVHKNWMRKTLLNINVAARDLQQAGFLCTSYSSHHKSTTAMTTLQEFSPLDRTI